MKNLEQEESETEQNPKEIDETTGKELLQESTTNKLSQEKTRKLQHLVSQKSTVLEDIQCRKRRLWLSYLFGILALCISATHLYCDHFYKDNGFDLMISGFNIVKRIDPSGVVASNQYMTVDLAFINSGNQHQSVLSANFVLPGHDIAGFSVEHWPMDFNRTVTEPFSVAPGETEVVHLVQPIDDEAILSWNRINADSTSPHNSDEYQIIVVEISAITTSGLPGESSFAIARISTTDYQQIRLYGNADLENPLGGVIYQRNFLDSLTVGRHSFQDYIRFIQSK